MSLSLKLNLDPFKKSIRKLEDEIPEIIKDGLEETGLRLVVMAVTREPKAPIYDGFLTGAFTVTVTDRDSIKDANYPTGGETGKNSKETLDADQIAEIDTSAMDTYEVRVGNSMKYAARLHEYPFTPGKWSQKRQGVGYKFLSSKLINYGDELNDLLAGFIRKRLKGKLFL